MTQIMANNRQGLTFEIVSARIAEEAENKRHVVYTLQVRFILGHDDLSPSVIERRYTHFLNLFNALKKEQVQLMSSIPFPKKVILGNFDNELISSRSTGFEALLKHISTESRLRNSKALLDFLQDIELNQIKLLLKTKDYVLAYPILENSFKLLNKVFTDRSPPVLLALCRLLACSMLVPKMPHSLKWGDLALHRYEGVSDSDLLELYLPLLESCTKIWNVYGRNIEELQKRIECLKRQRFRVDPTSLIDAVEKVEQKIYALNI